MKKSIQIVAAILILLVIPSLSIGSIAAAKPQAGIDERVSFTFAAGGVGGELLAWDPVIKSTSDYGSVEPLFTYGPNFRTVYVLATSFEIHSRPDETSSKGLNTGGIESITFILREGVKFTDGSDWNATVAKWNLDRNTYVTGYDNTKWAGIWWYNPTSDTGRFTANWNLTWHLSKPFAVSLDTGAPCKVAGNVSVPVINRTEIIDNYEIRVYFNKWNLRLTDLTTIGFISMQTYGELYTYKALEGYSGGGVKHMVGTGPYRMEYYDLVVAQSAKAIKNENYWNKTALEADGLFIVDDVYIRWYATAGARSQALLSGEADASGYMIQAALADLPALNASDEIDVVPTVYDASIDCINMLSREGLDTPNVYIGGKTFRQYYPTWAIAKGWGNISAPAGINRTVRLALSDAFDYEGYIAAQYASVGGGLRCKSPLGTESMYFDPSIPYHVLNLTKARATLLADPYYAAELAARGITESSTHEDWVAVGTSNPIQIFKYLGITGSAKTAFLESACNNLGFDIVVNTTSAMFTEWMVPGKSLQFDLWAYSWLNFKENPMEFWGKGMRLEYATWACVPLGMGYNFALLQNSTIDKLMDDIPWSGGALQQQMYNNLSNQLMNYHAPWLYIAHSQTGVAINTKWYYERAVGQIPYGDQGNTVITQFLGLKSEMPTETETTTRPSIPAYSFIALMGAALVTIGVLLYKRRR